MRFLVTAGPTREPIDPVRYLSNRSSGKMGYAIAEAAVAAGHATTLISGPVALAAPPGLARLVRVETAAQMGAAVRAEFGATDALVMCAAVADFRPARVAEHKIKKDGRATLTLELEPTEDILLSLPGRRRREQPSASAPAHHPLVVGFAAETRDLDAAARGKLAAKGCDLVVGNDVGRPGIGFDGDENALSLFFRDGSTRTLGRAPKRVLATMLVEIVAKLEKKG